MMLTARGEEATASSGSRWAPDTTEPSPSPALIGSRASRLCSGRAEPPADAPRTIEIGNWQIDSGVLSRESSP